MENTIKQNVEETPKKAWIAPEMEEIDVNGGIIGGIYEKSTTAGQRGMIS